MVHKKYYELLENQEKLLSRKNKNLIFIMVSMTVMNTRF